MIRILAIFLITILSCQAFALELTKNEVWNGLINLTENVIVPENITLTLTPGTKVTTNGNKIIAYGSVAIQGTADQQVIFGYFPQTTSTVEVIKVKPYDIDTDILKQEFDIFKVQYAILWSLLFASTFVMLEAR